MGAVIAAGVIGAGATIYGASQASKGSGEERSTDEIGQMPFGDYLSQLGDLQQQQGLNNSKYSKQLLRLYPKLAQAQRKQQSHSVNRMLKHYPQFTAAERTATGAQRTDDLGDMQRLGPEWAKVFESLSPGYGKLDALSLELENQARGDHEKTALRMKMDDQAMTDLDLGRSLSEEQIQDAQQASRAAWSARGLVGSNPALFAEVLNRDKYATERQAQRRAFAGSTLALGTDEDRVRFGDRNALAGLRSNLLLNTHNARLSPILAQMGRTGLNPYGMNPMFDAMPIGQASQILGGPAQVSGSAQSLQPLYNYGSDVNNTNFNAGEARAINGANAWTAAGGAAIGAAGDIYAAQQYNKPAQPAPAPPPATATH